MCRHKCLISSDPARIQTWNLLIRSQILYSVKLRGQFIRVFARIGAANIRDILFLTTGSLKIYYTPRQSGGINDNNYNFAV